MRSLAVAVILIGIFGLGVSPFARDASIGKRTPEEVKSVCDKVGGKFSQTRRDIIVEQIVVGAPAPIATSAAKLLSHASPKRSVVDVPQLF